MNYRRVLSAEIGLKVEQITSLNTPNDTTNEAETLLAQLTALNSYLETKQFDVRLSNKC